jgi:hypothetical protein
MGSFKNLLLQNHWLRKAEIYMKAFRHSTKSSLLKSWPPRVGWGHNRGNIFTDFYIRTTFQNLLLNNHRTRNVVIYMEASKHT